MGGGSEGRQDFRISALLDIVETRWYYSLCRRGVEQWQLVGLITRRSVVRIHPPLPNCGSLHEDVNADHARSQNMSKRRGPFPEYLSERASSFAQDHRRFGQGARRAFGQQQKTADTGEHHDPGAGLPARSCLGLGPHPPNSRAGEHRLERPWRGRFSGWSVSSRRRSKSQQACRGSAGIHVATMARR